MIIPTLKNHFKCDRCRWNQLSNDSAINCSICGEPMRLHASKDSSGPKLTIPEGMSPDDITNEINLRGNLHLVPKPINYIATYQAQLVDGDQVTANLSLENVPENASPGSIIEMITEQAYADIARSGMNASKVLVLNLSRVW